MEGFSDHRIEDGGWGEWLICQSFLFLNPISHIMILLCEIQSIFRHHDSKRNGRWTVATIDGSVAAGKDENDLEGTRAIRMRARPTAYESSTS